MAFSTQGIAKHRSTSPPAATAVSVDFTTTSYTIDALKSFGHCVSGYTGDIGDIRFSSTIQAFETALAPGLFRLGLKWDATNSRPIDGAYGGTGLGDDWVAGINSVKPAGAQIVAIAEGDITINGTLYPEMGCTPSDAASMVHYYNDNGGQHGGPIKYWVIGNEPDLNAQKYDYLGRQTYDGRTYGDTWLQLYAAMKAADATILIGGPTASSYGSHAKLPISGATSPGATSQFWNDYLATTRSGVGMVADLIDFMDWHYYGTGSANETTATVLGRVTGVTGDITNVRSLVNAYATNGTRGSNMTCIISEFNFAYTSNDGRNDLIDDYGIGQDGRFITAVNTVFIAAYILNILRSSGWGMEFSDVNGPLGLYTQNSLGDSMYSNGAQHHYPHDKPAGIRYPAYYGIGMWTGMGKFRRFGNSIVPTSGAPTNVQIFAATNTNDVMIINRDETVIRNLTVTLNGIANGTQVAVWSTNHNLPWDEPIKTMTLTVSGGTISGLIVQPLTVMRLVIG